MLSWPAEYSKRVGSPGENARLHETRENSKKSAGNCWLGGRDSNPDNMLQRHASYRWTTSQFGIPRRAETPIIYNLPMPKNAPKSAVKGGAYDETSSALRELSSPDEAGIEG